MDNTPPRKTPHLPCPECRMTKGHNTRIGNHRNTCGTCNRYVQHVRRVTLRLLKAEHADEIPTLERRAELECYPAVMARFDEQYPPPPSDG